MTRTKLVYPKIPGSSRAPLARCIAFEKYDGTNMHWVWERELGWYAFGMRRSEFDFDEQGIRDFNIQHPGYSDAPDIFNRDFASQLEEIFHNNPNYNSPEITVFTEYLGPNSFAGLHKDADPKELVLFDVETENSIVGPEEFVATFGFLNIAKVIYHGKLNGKFIQDVRAGKFAVNEGVVCKGGTGGKDLWMAKIKTKSYMKRLQEAFKNNWENYWE